MTPMPSATSIPAIVLLCVTLLLAARAGAAPGDPDKRPDTSAPDAIDWRFHSDLPDGRRLLTDGGLLLDAKLIPDAPVPEKSLPPKNAQKLLDSKTDHEFALKEVEPTAEGGHYLAPGEIQLNRKYIELLRRTKQKDRIRLAAKGAEDPVLIKDGDKVVGVMMPMKKATKPGK
jgi:hypothetical protein